ncbi:MAG: DUF1127 domain-containing protein [Gammaproteobacteria bacterium]
MNQITIKPAGEAATANILSGAFRPAFNARLAAMWSAYKTWRNRHLAVRELSAMPDALLRDIGIERRQIRDVVYNCGARPEALHAGGRRAAVCEAAPRETQKAA